MNKKTFRIENLLMILGILVGVVIFIGWIWSSQESVSVRAPISENAPGSSGEGQDPSGPGLGTLKTFSTQEPKVGPYVWWPSFRGDGRDGIYEDPQVKLSTSWAEKGPSVLWEIEAGEGYAGAAIYEGRVYLLDYDASEKMDVLRCLSLETGENFWEYSYPVKIKRNHGMSRTVPAVTGDFVVTIGPKCHVMCLNNRTGELVWGLDLVKEYGSEVPRWYTGQCPLIENGKLILAPGGKSLLVAVDCATGKRIWESSNPDQWQMTHASIIPMTYQGVHLYVYCTSGGVVGVDSQNGSILFRYPGWKIRTLVPSPVILEDGGIFLSGGYNSGSMTIQLVDQGANQPERFKVEQVVQLSPEVFGATQQTPIFYKGHLYGVRPDEQMVCMTAEGDILWGSGAGRKFGLGPFMIANGLLYAMDGDGHLSLMEARPDKYQLLSESSVLANAHESWGPMAMAAGKLIVRDLERVICLDVRLPGKTE